MIDRLLPSTISPSLRQSGACGQPTRRRPRQQGANLTFDFEALADANEYFRGKTGLILIFVEGPFTLSHACRIFPCALHHFRPELSPGEALKLMTRPSVIAVLCMLGLGATSSFARDHGEVWSARVCGRFRRRKAGFSLPRASETAVGAGVRRKERYAFACGRVRRASRGHRVRDK